MNLLLLGADEINADGVATLTDRRAKHAFEVLRVQAGQTLRVGMRGGLIGSGEVLEKDRQRLVLRVQLNELPPQRLGVDVLLAVPRPKALKRVVSCLASLGVGRVVLLNAARVERSYFDSKVLAPAFLDEWLQLGLEQARDTTAPTIEVRERFKPFVEDELSTWLTTNTKALVPHPGARQHLKPTPREQHVTVAIGPDGGWVPFEVELLAANGFTPVALGPRILRVENAVPFVLGALRPSA